jgi:hypothetical protein
MANIDPVQFGKLVECVQNLTEKLEKIETKLEKIETDLTELNKLKHTGKGIMLGALIGGGTLGATLSNMWEYLGR